VCGGVVRAVPTHFSNRKCWTEENSRFYLLRIRVQQPARGWSNGYSPERRVESNRTRFPGQNGNEM